jgi:hypothetical protein
MKKYFLAAAICAIGGVGVMAAPAFADLGPEVLPPPSAVQIFREPGLTQTIECPDRTADPVCAGGVRGSLALMDVLKLPPGPTHRIALAREIDPLGNWYSYAAANDESVAFVARIDLLGLPGATAQETGFVVWDGTRTIVVNRTP